MYLKRGFACVTITHVHKPGPRRWSTSLYSVSHFPFHSLQNTSNSSDYKSKHHPKSQRIPKSAFKGGYGREYIWLAVFKAALPEEEPSAGEFRLEVQSVSISRRYSGALSGATGSERDAGPARASLTRTRTAGERLSTPSWLTGSVPGISRMNTKNRGEKLWIGNLLKLIFLQEAVWVRLKGPRTSNCALVAARQVGSLQTQTYKCWD